MKPLVKVFSTCTGKYFYDVGKNQIVRINESEYRALIKYKSLEQQQVDFYNNLSNEFSVIHKLIEKGFLSVKTPNRIKHPYTDIVEDVLSKKMHTAILQITQMCNLKCRYCPYSGNGYLDRKHFNKSMSFEVAKKSIDFIFSNGRFSDYFNIGFYGGEPLIQFELIKQIVKYAQEKAGSKKVFFFTTTNGTLLSKEIIAFLSENDFSVTVSLDGPEFIHDKNRRNAIDGTGSFKKVYDALKLILVEHPDFINKIGINAVWDMEESYRTIMDFFSHDPVLCQFMYSVVPVDNMIIDASFTMVNENYHQQQFSEMISMMNTLNMISTKDMERDSVSLKFIDDIENALIPRIEMPDEVHYGGMCLPGYNRLLIDVDGNFLPCEKVSENSEIAKIGDIYSGFNYGHISKIMNVGSISSKDCKECWCGQFCTCCFKFIDDLHSMSKEKKQYECKQIKRSILKAMKEYVIFKEAKRVLLQANS